MMRLVGRDPGYIDKAEEGLRYFQPIHHLEITADDDNKGRLVKLVVDRSYEDLASIILPISNRCLRAVRNEGRVSSVHEMGVPPGRDSSVLLLDWELEASGDGEKWEKVHDLEALMHAIASRMAGLRFGGFQDDLPTSLWPYVEETIQEDRDPAPEDEFTTNAMEHLFLKNYRLAVLEAVIALEISLTAYLCAYLKHHAGSSQARIKKVTQSGLASRVAGMLDTTLSKQDRDKVDLDLVLEVISWRNDITHHGGRLKRGASEDRIRRGILQVVALVLLLQMRARQASATPTVNAIAESIQKKHDVSRPAIWFYKGHKVFVRFVSFFSKREFEDAAKIESVVADLSERLKQHDEKFVPNEDLYVRIVEFPDKTVARWSRGNLEIGGK